MEMGLSCSGRVTCLAHPLELSISGSLSAYRSGDLFSVGAEGHGGDTGSRAARSARERKICPGQAAGPPTPWATPPGLPSLQSRPFRADALFPACVDRMSKDARLVSQAVTFRIHRFVRDTNTRWWRPASQAPVCVREREREKETA